MHCHVVLVHRKLTLSPSSVEMLHDLVILAKFEVITVKSLSSMSRMIFSLLTQMESSSDAALPGTCADHFFLYFTSMKPLPMLLLLDNEILVEPPPYHVHLLHLQNLKMYVSLYLEHFYDIHNVKEILYFHVTEPYFSMSLQHIFLTIKFILPLGELCNSFLNFFSIPPFVCCQLTAADLNFCFLDAGIQQGD